MDDDTRSSEAEEQRRTVLNVFGLTLEVSNPRLAELLTMDAREALTTDVREVFSGGVHDAEGETSAFAPPDLLSAQSPLSEREVSARRDSRERVADLGRRLGFSVRHDGSWVSPTGIVILVRDLAGTVTLAAAAHFVQELLNVVARSAEADSTCVLFVTRDRDAADVVKVAIRHARAYSVMRVATFADLDDLARLVESGSASHEQTLALVAPLAAVDVGEVLAVLRAGRSHGEQEP